MENHELTIDRMNLTLPAEMRGKERIFAKHLASEFGRLRADGDAEIPQIRIPPITPRPGESSALLAKRVAHELSRLITTGESPRKQGGDE